jgi:hypothetical protein
VSQQLGASVGTALLNTIYASAISSYLAVNLASSSANRRTVTGLALAHGYDTTFRWTAGIFAAGALIGGVVLRSGPLVPAAQQTRADDAVRKPELGLDPSPAG